MQDGQDTFNNTHARVTVSYTAERLIKAWDVRKENLAKDATSLQHTQADRQPVPEDCWL